MVQTATLIASRLLFAKSVPAFPWSNDPIAGPLTFGADDNGIPFAYSANTPFVYNYQTVGGAWPFAPYTIEYINWPTTSTPQTVTVSDGLPQNATSASWNGVAVPGIQYGLNPSGQITYPGDAVYTNGPYTITVGDGSGGQNLAFSDATDQSHWHELGINGVPYTTQGGFAVAIGNYNDGTGPIILFIDPLWQTYVRVTVHAAVGDVAAASWMSRYIEACNTPGSIATQVSCIFDGYSYWMVMEGGNTNATGLGTFGLLEIPFATPPSPPPPPAPAIAHIIPAIGARSLGPAFLGMCCNDGVSTPLYPTASGTR